MMDIEAMLQRLNPNAEEYVPSTVQHRPTAIVRTIPSRYASFKRNSMQKPQKVPACAERWRRQPRTLQKNNLLHFSCPAVRSLIVESSQGEKEMCARTIYCTNIDKKVAHSDVKLFFESLCGEVSRLRLLGDSQHSTRIAFVEFVIVSPGPATPHPRVLAAASLPLVGHMHPEFLTVMDEVKTWLQYTFQTQNPFTIAVSGSGHAAMEAAVASVVEPGDVVLVGVNGIWGERMMILAARYGADVRKMEAEPGKVFSAADVEKALADNPGVKVVFVVHGESSTGTLQPLEGLGELCHKNGALLFVDAVCTLGGIPLHVDAWGVDAIYSGSQKCLSAPVAPSPLSLSERARAKLANRSTPVQSYYFDMNLVGEYWGVDGQPRKYHHTGLVTNVNAMREALAMLAEEGLENVWQRHRSQAELLWAGLQELGLDLFVEDHDSRLPTVTTVKVPEGVEWTKVTGHLMSKFNLEIAGGLGPTVGKVCCA
ncbi:unnamed protein product [Closterium sp. Naga37s-1]|nr:unnamed protein product [Closterium sp. Naga37s-1]